MRPAMLLTLLATTAALAGCGETADPEEPSSPHDDAAELRDDLMVSEPSTTQAGSRVDLSFPEETERGLGFVLEEETDDGWAVRYFLTSAPANQGPDEPSWTTAAEGEPGWDAVAIGGPGPDVVEVPGTADDGVYRVCTATSAENYCTQIRVTND